MKKYIARAVLGLGLSLGSAFAQRAAPAFELPATDGTHHALHQYAGRIVVLEWTNYDCPFVRKFYDEGAMQQWQSHYTQRGIIWLSICSSAPGKQGHFSSEEWSRRIRAARAHPTAVLLDESGAVGRAYGARNTPQLFVVGPAGHLVYQGAIDDRRSADPDTLRGAKNYLLEALDALLEGLPVPISQTKPYGCSVKYDLNSVQ